LRTELLKQPGQGQDFGLHIIRQPEELRLELVANLDNPTHLDNMTCRTYDVKHIQPSPLFFVVLFIGVNNYTKQRIGIVGYRGYSGAELVRILSSHPLTEPILLDHRLDHRADAPAAPALRRPSTLQRVPCTAEAVRQHELSVVFLATPPEASMELAPAMLAAGARVVDLSGAFRLGTPENYTAWYKQAHTQPELLAEAVYAIPEFHRAQVPAARLVANPGCYPTAANLALRPLVAAGVIDRSAGIVCDAKSGTSGAGNKPSPKTLFCEVDENFSAYSILFHRHVPEILQTSGLQEAELSFTAQLLPIERGILETIYFRAPSACTAEDLLAIYEQAYAAEPFIRLYNPGHVPDLHAVARTNFCDIGVTFDPKTKRAVVVSAIDNLVKGAAGQAVQNMNLLLGFPETAGLLTPALSTEALP
jgi:N-acetyl-gamma-glutamyl-phosphate reductase